MNLFKTLSVCILILTLLISGICTAEQTYDATRESLVKHGDAPEWFRDAKLGIYFHWGVYSVPAYGSEWYPRQMYIKNDRVYRHHVKTWGDPQEFEYADFVPMFRAEHFNADEWAALFRKAGARFSGPVAEHHDGFAMWDSDVTPWNAMDMGPKRDITGELEKAIRKQDMRFITTFHHARNNLWEESSGKWTGHYDHIKRNFPSLLEDKLRAILYGYMPRDQFVDMWKNKLVEVIDNYRPDIIWFDSWLHEIPEKDRFEFAAYYFNQSKKNDQEVLIVRKQDDMPLEFSINDHEKSRESGANEQIWMTADTVSKNGIVLLNISPMADGTIPAVQQKVLLELGQWMQINGEGIYGTRPWKVYGEGPTREPGGGFGDAHKFLNLRYSSKDIRYTRSKDGKILYAISLGRPDEDLVLKALYVHEVDSGNISLLGSDVTVPFTINPDQSLTLHTARLANIEWPSDAAVVVKLSGFDFDVNPNYAPDTRSLKAEKALLNGQGIRLEKQDNRTNIGYWDRSDEDVHWLMKIPHVGDYRFRGEFAAVDGSQLVMQVNGKEIPFSVGSTGAWDKPSLVDMGTIHFDKPGVYHFRLSPKQDGSYRPVNLWTIQYY